MVPAQSGRKASCDAYPPEDPEGIVERPPAVEWYLSLRVRYFPLLLAAISPVFAAACGRLTGVPDVPDIEDSSAAANESGSGSAADGAGLSTSLAGIGSGMDGSGLSTSAASSGGSASVVGVDASGPGSEGGGLSSAVGDALASSGGSAGVSGVDASGPGLEEGGVDGAVGDGGISGDGATIFGDPQTCEQAAQAYTYLGCDYWPTVVANDVWSIFDFAVLVANPGTSAAMITVTGPPAPNETSMTNVTATVEPGQLAPIYLPWVPALKGPDSDNCGSSVPFTSSVMATGGAFHLVSSAPVTVYQFNALEYEGNGGPPGKDWSTCPGDTLCIPAGPYLPQVLGCYSFSNDASLLLPSTAMTGNYRVTGHGGIVLVDTATDASTSSGAYMAVTGTQNATTVNVQVSANGQIAAGVGIAATDAGGTLTLTLNAGDVAELLGPGGTDLSGSIVQATAPIQVITGHPCYQIPPTTPACDHMEESVFPAETLGKDYVVTRPAGPDGGSVEHQVRFYGNFDNTHLTYDPATPPPGCPTALNAGQVVECGDGGPCPTMNVDPEKTYNCGMIDQDFEVTGDQPFAVGTFTLGASVVDPGAMAPKQMGDPAESFPTAVEQYRTRYVFVAPVGYPVNYVDIVAQPATTITLDGQTIGGTPEAVGSSEYAVYRVELGVGQAGAHVLVASQPVGIQVLGYGSYTSYMYPGGLNLAQVAPPPLVP